MGFIRDQYEAAKKKAQGVAQDLSNQGFNRDFFTPEATATSGRMIGNAFKGAAQDTGKFIKTISAPETSYVQNQIVQPTRQATQNIAQIQVDRYQGKKTTPGQYAGATLPLLQAGFNASPAGVMFNARQGLATAGLETARNRGDYKQLINNTYKDVTTPTSFAQTGLNVQNPYAAAAIDIAAGNPRGTLGGLANLRNISAEAGVIKNLRTVGKSVGQIAGFSHPDTTVAEDVKTLGTGAKNVAAGANTYGKTLVNQKAYKRAAALHEAPIENPQLTLKGNVPVSMNGEPVPASTHSPVTMNLKDGEKALLNMKVPDTVINTPNSKDVGTVTAMIDPKTREIKSWKTDNPAFEAKIKQAALGPMVSAPNYDEYAGLKSTPASPDENFSLEGAQFRSRPSAADMGKADVPVSEPAYMQSRDVKPLIPNLAGGKERGFVTSVKNSVLPEDIKGATTGTYDVKANKALIADAQANIKNQGPIQRYTELIHKGSQDVNDQDIAESIILAKQLGNSGDTQAAAELLSKTAEKLTEAGRTVQAASLLNKIEPEGVLYMAGKEAKKAGVQLTKEQTDDFFNRATDIKNMTDVREQNIARKKLFDDIAAVIPTPWWHKVTTVWKAGLLTGLKTTGRNVVSNAINEGSEVAKDAPASLVDSFLSLKTGERTKTLTTKGYGKGFGIGLNKAKDIATLGFDPEETINKLDVARINWGKDPVQQALKKYTDVVFNALSAQDRPFYHGALKRSLYDQAGAAAINAGKRGDKAFVEHLVQNPNEQMMKTAIRDAEISTFANSNTARQAITSAKRFFGDGPAAHIISEMTMPFTGVPTSVAGQMAAYSPVGLASGTVKAAKVLLGKGNASIQRQAAEEIGRGVIGSGIMAAGASLMAHGLMTGDYPTDAKEQQQWDLEGKQANSVLVNGKWRSVGSLGPQASILLIGGKAYTIAQGEGSAGDKAVAVAASGAKTLTNATFLSGVSGVLDAVNDPARNGVKLYNSTVGSLTPTLVKDAAKGLDTDQNGNQITRETNTPGEAFSNTIPLLRNQNTAKRNSLGDVVTGAAGAPMNFVDIFNSKTASSDPTVQELRHLMDSGNSVTPTKLQPTVKSQGQTVKLTPTELDNMEQVTGGQIKSRFAQVIATPEYQSLPDDQRAKVLQGVIDEVRSTAKKGIIGGDSAVSALTAPATNTDELNLARAQVESGSKSQMQVGDTLIYRDAAGKVHEKKITTKTTTPKIKKVATPKIAKIAAPKKAKAIKKPTIRKISVATPKYRTTSKYKKIRVRKA